MVHDIAPRAHAARLKYLIGGDAESGSAVDHAGGEYTGFGSFFLLEFFRPWKQYKAGRARERVAALRVTSLRLVFDVSGIALLCCRHGIQAPDCDCWSRQAGQRFSSGT